MFEATVCPNLLSCEITEVGWTYASALSGVHVLVDTPSVTEIETKSIDTTSVATTVALANGIGDAVKISSVVLTV